ncbi:MAG: bifunctional phosphopantothenoylcysteine decarboxylase/phosphopantothenate--cysteine ligase CoaBC [Gammaproteobacteria bacterium]|nr:bifunctional phosphopantothenoylcysteine decarboxylase/phosphopantothenate--cysteine ligase CoaBC [Gammaproteobacteria bacterium]
MKSLQNLRIVLGITGGIAAYKSPDLVRRLMERGASVRVVMTTSATAFVGPLTLQAVSGQPVATNVLAMADGNAMGHIELARWADLVLVAPASADFLARLRMGRADDLLAAVCLTTTAPIALAPAMNQQMWQAPATVENCVVLRERGIHMIGPAAGAQACGEVGPGRMEEPLAIVEQVAEMFANRALAGRKVLITAGPTREPIDPVRYITNRSSGRMGYALADAARDAGAAVTLISGPVTLTPPDQVELISVETAAQMHEAVMSKVVGQDIFIGCAAVADYTPAAPAARKMKKSEVDLALTLQPTADILAAVAGSGNGLFTVGFAAETDNLALNARAKLQRKALDMIAANLVGGPDRGFDSADNELHVFWADGDRVLPLASKSRLARELVALIAERYQAARSANVGD